MGCKISVDLRETLKSPIMRKSSKVAAIVKSEEMVERPSMDKSTSPIKDSIFLKDLSAPPCPSTPPKENESPKISPVPSWITDSEIEVYSGSDYDYKD
tara:strand:+ start:303 stop:596 length:294 start_codon:yes stop_codon:yes gene_type:complete